jgi:hypothetical protein
MQSNIVFHKSMNIIFQRVNFAIQKCLVEQHVVRLYIKLTEVYIKKLYI